MQQEDLTRLHTKYFLQKKGLRPTEQTEKVSGWQENEQMYLVKSFNTTQSANLEKKQSDIRNHLFYC